MDSFWTLCRKPNSPIFLSKFRYYLILGPNKSLPVDITFFEVSFVKQHFSLIFGQFSYALSKTKLAYFFVKIFLLSYIVTKYGVPGWYTYLRSKFRKITLFLLFRTIFIDFAQNQTYLFFWSNFVVILSWVQIMGFQLILCSSK